MTSHKDQSHPMRRSDEFSSDAREPDRAEEHPVQDELPPASLSPTSSVEASTSSDARTNQTPSSAGVQVTVLGDGPVTVIGNVFGSTFNRGESSAGTENQQAYDSTDQGNQTLAARTEDQQADDSTDQGNQTPAGQSHWWLCCIAFGVLVLAILIARCNFHGETPPSSQVQVQRGESMPTPKAISDVDYCQQQLIQFYKTTASTIPAHPLLPSRTVGIDEFFVHLELSKDIPGTTMPGERVKLSGIESILDRVQTVPLNTWEDLFKPEIVKESKILLSGGAGYGKTTIVGNIVNVWSNKGQLAKFKLVFLLKLRQMQKSGCILDAIFDQILPKDTELTKSKMTEIIAANQADIAFLLDGLDEIPSDALESSDGVYAIKDILYNKALRNSYVLVTTRPHMIDAVLRGYKHYANVKILGFTNANRNKFLKSYFADNIISGEALIASLNSRPILNRLAEIPIISQMVCIVWKNQESLPHNISALYSKFAEVLVKRRVVDTQQWQKRMKSVFNGLGQVALNGLLDSKDKRLMFDRDKFSECDSCLKDGCVFGFLQRESFTSGLDIKELVTFYHLSFQEYFAARYLIHCFDNDKKTFHRMLKRIDSQNLEEMENLLRFVCGQSLKAASLILDHVQKLIGDQDQNERHLRLLRLLLFETGSKKLARKVSPPKYLYSKTFEDLISLQFYLQALPYSVINTYIVLLTCNSYDDVTLAYDILLNVNIPLSTDVIILYTVSELRHGESRSLEKTLKSIDKSLRKRLILSLYFNDKSIFNLGEMSQSLTHLSRDQFKMVCVGMEKLLQRNVTRMVSALKKFRLDCFVVYDVNMHGRLMELAPLITPSLKHMTCQMCGLLDDDVTHFMELLRKSTNGLKSLHIGGNHFSFDSMKRFALYLRNNYPRLEIFIQDNSMRNELILPALHRLSPKHSLLTDLDLELDSDEEPELS